MAEHFVLRGAASKPTSSASAAPAPANHRRSLSHGSYSLGPGGNSNTNTSAAEANKEKENESLSLLLRALPLKVLLYLTYQYGDVLFWAGTAQGKADTSSAPYSTGEDGIKKGNSNKKDNTNGSRRAYRRHHDPISALLAYQLLVSIMPYAQKSIEKISGLSHLHVILPSMFKSIDIQVEQDMPTLANAHKAATSSGATTIDVTSPIPSSYTDTEGGPAPPATTTWGRNYIWQPKALSREAQDTSNFFGQAVGDATASICSPTFQHSLRTLYRTLFSHLLGGPSLFSTLEQVFEGINPSGACMHNRRQLLPTQMIHVPGVLVPILSTISAAAGMSTSEGLIQTVATRPQAKGDAGNHDLNPFHSRNDVVTARASAAKLVAEKALRFVHNLYMESNEMKELFRGEIPATMVSQGVSGGISSRFGRPPRPEELAEELAQVYYSGLAAQLAQHYNKTEAGSSGKATAAGGKGVKKPANVVVGSTTSSPMRSPGAKTPSKRGLGSGGAVSPTPISIDLTGSGELPSTTPAPAPPAVPLEKLGQSPICRLALRFLISLLFDRLLHQSKATHSIQSLLDVWPRDLHLFNPDPGFAETLQVMTDDDNIIFGH